MWGTQPQLFFLHSLVRFIPTHVGNTSKVFFGFFFNSVHPHACGEHGRSRTTIPPWIGSSPRMWGTRRELVGGPGIPRFIPTHVGNTRSTTGPTTRRSVHPHACGEHPSREPEQFPGLGSSPRMWGTRHRGIAGPMTGWFIPTHVGNTIRPP